MRLTANQNKTKQVMGLPRITKREEKFALTDQELLTIADDVARKRSQKRQAEQDKKSSASQYKSQIDRLDGEIVELDDKMINKHEYRTSECRIKYDLDERKVRVVSKVSGKVLEERAMTQTEVDQLVEEQQADMFEEIKAGTQFKGEQDGDIITVTKVHDKGSDVSEYVVDVDSDDFPGKVEVNDLMNMGYMPYSPEDEEQRVNTDPDIEPRSEDVEDHTAYEIEGEESDQDSESEEMSAKQNNQEDEELPL